VSFRWIVDKPETDRERGLLGQKSRVRGRILVVVKVAKADADEAEALMRVEDDRFAQWQGDICQLLARRRRRTWGVAASENLEFAGFQFQRNSTCDSWPMSCSSMESIEWQ
jgi:hypothetical protein